MDYPALSYEDKTIDDEVKHCLDSTRIKICPICGKSFVKYGRFKFCSRKHYRICEICDKEFTIDLSRGVKLLNRTCSRECSNELTRRSVINYNTVHPKIKSTTIKKKTLVCEYCNQPFEVDAYINRKFCSAECRRNARKEKFQSTTRKCRICGREFHPVNTRSWYCEGPHFVPCVICGKDIEITTPGDISGLTCSNECRQILRQQTSLQNWGFDFACKHPDLRKQLRDIQISLEPEKQARLKAMYGVTNVAQIPEVKSKISKTVRSEDCQTRMQNTTLVRHGVRYAMQSRELFLKQANAAKHTYTSDGTRVDSSYEKRFYEFCLRAGLPIDMQVPYNYELDERSHITYVDFRVDSVLIEAKGAHLLKSIIYRENPIDAKKHEIYRNLNIILISDKYAKDMMQDFENVTCVDVRVFDDEGRELLIWKNILKASRLRKSQFLEIGDVTESIEP